MMNPVLKTAAFAVIGMAYSLCLNAAGTWYVDAAKYGQAGMDGSSAKPYGTIQEAVNAAKNGDVIKVAPGLYNQGVQSTNENSITTLSRVQIVGKALTLEATGAKAETIIEGARAATDSGLGADAVRCILFMGARTTNSVVRGFTLRGGRTLSATEAKSDSILNSGGAVMGHWDSTYSTFKNLATLIDCDVLDCGATRGGALRCVNAIRCRFLRCFATNNGAVSRNGSFFNCLFAHSYGASTSMAALDYFAVALNCTFVDNDVRAVKGYKSNNAGKTYNCYVGFCGGDGGAFTHEAPKDAESLPYVFNSVVHTNYVSSTYLPLTTNCVLTIDQMQLASPATGDYHPLAEADETMRIASVDDYNANFPERFADEANKDLEGQPRVDAQGWLRVGALETPVTPASGFVFLADKEDGRSEEIVVNAITSRVVVTKMATCTYLTTPTWPATVEVTFTPAAATAETYDLFGVEYRNSSFSSFKFPRRGESRVVVMSPPQAVRNTYLYPNYGERRYVATTGTDATTDDQGLSAAKPWKTLQYAADNAPSNAVIHVAAGDYDEGFNVQSGDVTNRLYIANRIRFVADEGPAATRILGAPDPSVTDPDAVGCGAGAIRCVCAKKGTHSCVQGFTLENGHTQSNSSGSDGSGGGYLAGYKIHDAYLVDSVVTNCSGSRGAVYGGVVSRCLIVGNKIEKKGNGVTRGAALVSSIVRANDSVSRTGNFADVGQDVVAINSTVDTSVNGYSLNHLIDIVNSIVDGGDIPNDGVLRTCAGTLFSPNTTYYPALDGRYGDPCFLDKIGGDYRLYACSPAVQGTATNDYTIVNAWRYVSGDYEGRPFTFNASGTPIAGALQATAPGRALYVAADGPGAAGATVVPSGVTVLADDTPVTVTTAGSVRPCVGLEINGVFHPGLTATTIDPTTLGPNEGVRVRVLFSTDWYVDAVKGNDANTGWATNAAMKTLVGVMAKAAQGDTVHALPGVYNEGSAVHDGAYLDATSKGWGEAPIPARVVVQTNVTLAAMGTADETVIEGALGTQRSTRATGSTYETRYLQNPCAMSKTAASPLVASLHF